MLDTSDAETFRQAAGTGLYMSIDRPSLQYAMSVVMRADKLTKKSVSCTGEVWQSHD